MEIDDVIHKIESRVRDLRRDYELYFKGDLRRQPLTERQQLQEALDKLQATYVTNTQVKFRIQTVANSFLAACRYWDRILLQIEMGTYKPDRFKADMRVGRINPETREMEKPVFQPPPKKDLLEDREERTLRSLHAQFIEARRVTGESADVSYDTFKRSVQKQKPALESKLGGPVRFKIVIENGKAKVKGASTK